MKRYSEYRIVYRMSNYSNVFFYFTEGRTGGWLPRWQQIDLFCNLDQAVSSLKDKMQPTIIYDAEGNVQSSSSN